MSVFKNIFLDPATFTLDASSTVRVSQRTSLFDGKLLNVDDTLLTENFGTGTGTFTTPLYTMTVTSGQYRIKSSKHYFPYFSGKSQLIECTFQNFHSEANVTKRVGYFSSNAVAPFNSNLDGMFLENTGTTIDLVVTNNGTEKLRKHINEWDNYNLISSYNWSNFTVIAFDYLWLGGAVLRLFLKTDRGFILCHTFNYSGTAQDTFMLSLNHKVRYEIRSTTGSGTFTYICSSVMTEGSISESGKQRSVNTGSTSITLATVGTTYPIKAIRKSTTHRDRVIKQVGMKTFVSSNTDVLLTTLQLNPTLSAPLTFTTIPNSYAEEASGNGTITVTSPGIILWSDILPQNAMSPNNILNEDYLSHIGMSLDNISDQLVLCGTPITSRITCNGVMNYKEF